MKRLGAVVVIPLLASCASLAPVPPPAAPPVPVPPAPPAAAPVPQPPPRAPGPRDWMPADSLPSAAALAVLARIPEPLPGTPARDEATPSPPVPRRAPAPEAAFDTLRAERPPTAAPTDGPPRPAPPTPAPTPVLGQRPHAAADSTPARPPAPPPSAATPPATPPAGPPAAVPPRAASADTCWRIQLAAPSERARAEAMRDAAHSVLVTPMVIELEDARWKVRSRPCLGRVAAEALRQRALDSGFAGVFLVRVAPAP